MKKPIAIIFILFFSMISVFAGPFGLSKGMTYDQVKEACGGREPVKVAEGRYLIVPTKPHPYFTRYVAWIDAKEGLNYIKAIGADISTNGYGIELRSKYDSIEASLSKNYGTGDKTSLLLPGSIWDDPDDWMKALEKKERYLMTIWSKKYGSTLPEEITSICIAACAESSSSGYVCLEYEFSNHETVSAAEKEAEDSVF
ncbi:MAG: hypothetical protein K6C97_08515 [Treponema sp.]|nr:hypothetical protein [Treponema sp.]